MLVAIVCPTCLCAHINKIKLTAERHIYNVEKGARSRELGAPDRSWQTVFEFWSWKMCKRVQAARTKRPTKMCIRWINKRGNGINFPHLLFISISTKYGNYGHIKVQCTRRAWEGRRAQGTMSLFVRHYVIVNCLSPDKAAHLQSHHLQSELYGALNTRQFPMYVVINGELGLRLNYYGQKANSVEHSKLSQIAWNSFELFTHSAAKNQCLLISGVRYPFHHPRHRCQACDWWTML